MIKLTREQLREIDRRSIEEFHIPGIILMENAASVVTQTVERLLNNHTGRFITIFCGGGNNGGDGLAVARQLHNRGQHVDVIALFDPGKLKGDALTNWKIVDAMGLDVFDAIEVEEAAATKPDVIIDALLGTGSTGAPRGEIARAIDAINAGRGDARVVAVDLPSGMDCNSGETPGICIRATHTVTFVAPKVGFDHAAAKEFLGEMIVGDIGCPIELIESVYSASKNENA